MVGRSISSPHSLICYKDAEKEGSHKIVKDMNPIEEDSLKDYGLNEDSLVNDQEEVARANRGRGSTIQACSKVLRVDDRILSIAITVGKIKIEE